MEYYYYKRFNLVRFKLNENLKVESLELWTFPCSRIPIRCNLRGTTRTNITNTVSCWKEFFKAAWTWEKFYKYEQANLNIQGERNQPVGKATPIPLLTLTSYNCSNTSNVYELEWGRGKWHAVGHKKMTSIIHAVDGYLCLCKLVDHFANPGFNTTRKEWASSHRLTGIRRLNN